MSRDDCDPFDRGEKPLGKMSSQPGHRRFAPRTRRRKSGAGDHHKRASEWLRANGYFDARSEYEITTYAGVVYKKDLFGFADRVAVKDGQFYAFQLCTATGKNAHLRKLVSRATLLGFQGATYEENVRGFLDHGGRLYLMVFDQPRGARSRWTMDLIEVTHELLDTVAARGRKHKQRR